MSNVGFIGLGIMGKPMALNLIKGGHTLHLHSRSGVPEELTAAGGRACKSAKEVAQRADVIITMVPDTPDVEKVLFGAGGVADITARVVAQKMSEQMGQQVLVDNFSSYAQAVPITPTLLTALVFWLLPH